MHYSFTENKLENDSKEGGKKRDPHSNREIAHVCPGTPSQCANFTFKFPLLDFTSDSNFPETNDPAFVSTDNPRTVRANADASRARFRVVKLKTPVIGERL